ncbi:GNAT family N-acetyltransferase [Tissierella sp.]|uniref:GNAT family N-acetyltransferase n=1 Tax=Tissierella sp. TaxID=41274 RepID=UPI00285C4CF4|nr:GNAT family N-acetyltransferase [Tissierella sp.]MDR7856727.1 GNAT family N-acetyltransferase [Tissierella sp.]
MREMTIRKLEKKDHDRVLQLNDESVHFLSSLTKDKLESIISQCEITNVMEVDGRVEAFVLTLKEGKEYDSVNYLWFSNHYDHYIYIDRVVVSLKMQGKGLGNILYESVFNHAKLIGVPYVAAEIDINPPNHGSLKFHEKFGFVEVGKQTVAQGKKVVSLQVVNL